MVLTSNLFTKPANEKSNQKLRDCERSDLAHIVAAEPEKGIRGVNDQGGHVALIHQALRKVMPNPTFGLEEATETYGPNTARVVQQFKANHNPPILNKALHQTVPDNIVGKQTIFFLDQEVKKAEG